MLNINFYLDFSIECEAAPWVRRMFLMSRPVRAKASLGHCVLMLLLLQSVVSLRHYTQGAATLCSGLMACCSSGAHKNVYAGLVLIYGERF